jgi:2-keto-3-deoxy-6-phosphogluconate aldolase
MIKARLHGMMMWTQFCAERGVSAQAMAEIANPGVVMANFATYVNDSKVTDKWKADSRPAAVILFDLLLPGVKLTGSATVTIRRLAK